MAKALVYLVPKGTRGLTDASVVANAGTDDDGRWMLPEGVSSTDRWICAIHEEWLPVCVDGDRVRAESEVSLTVGQGGVINVRLVGSSSSSNLLTQVRVDGVAGVDTFPFPGPSGRPVPLVISQMHGVTEKSLRVGTMGPVVVSAERWGAFCEPEAVHLDRPYGEVSFEFLDSCQLEVVVRAASDGRVIQDLRAEMREADTPKMVALKLVRSPDGVVLFQHGLRPGAYDVYIDSSTFATGVLRSVVLTTPGARESRSLFLHSEPAPPGLELRWDGTKSEIVPGSIDVYTRLSGAPESDWRAAERVVAIDDHSCFVRPVRFAVPFSLLAVARKNGLVAVAGPLEVGEGRREQAMLEWRAGAIVDMSSLIRSGLHATQVKVQTGGLGLLPLVAGRPERVQFYLPDQAIARDSVLGPYPSPATVEAQLSDGTRVVKEVTAEEGQRR